MNATPILQTIPVAPGRRPLMPFKTLMWALYRDEDFVTTLIGERKLIAFNIAAPDARNAHAVIWLPSILDYLAQRPPTRADDETIIADILPGQQATFPTSYLARLFSVGRDHIKNLVDAGALEIKNPGKLRRGPHVTRWILRESLIQFLKQARIS